MQKSSQSTDDWYHDTFSLVNPKHLHCIKTSAMDKNPDQTWWLGLSSFFLVCIDSWTKIRNDLLELPLSIHCFQNRYSTISISNQCVSECIVLRGLGCCHLTKNQVWGRHELVIQLYKPKWKKDVNMKSSIVELWDDKEEGRCKNDTCSERSRPTGVVE